MSKSHHKLNIIKYESGRNRYHERYIRFSIGLIAAIWIIYLVVLKFFIPTTVNDVALRQFDNTAASFSDMQIVNFILNNGFLIPVILTIVVALGLIFVMKNR